MKQRFVVVSSRPMKLAFDKLSCRFDYQPAILQAVLLGANKSTGIMHWTEVLEPALAIFVKSTPRTRSMPSFVLRDMVTITRSTKEPLPYLAMLWIATISVVVLAVLARFGRIQLGEQWLVDCLAIVFCIATVHTTFRTAFPIEYKAVINSETVELTNTFAPHARTSITKNEVRYFFRWKKVWYRPHAWIYHVRYLCHDNRIDLIGMRYISPLDTPQFFDAIRTIWGEAYVRDQQ